VVYETMSVTGEWRIGKKTGGNKGNLVGFWREPRRSRPIGATQEREIPHCADSVRNDVRGAADRQMEWPNEYDYARIDFVVRFGWMVW
jgi:hypothetical protein